MIKYLSRYLPRHSLDQIYKLHVRPHFDYCDVIHHIPNHEDPFSGNTAVHYTMSWFGKHLQTEDGTVG